MPGTRCVNTAQARQTLEVCMESLPTRTCPHCGVAKPATRDYFYFPKGKIDSWCSECRREYVKAYNRADPERHRARTRAWVEANREKKRQADKAYAEANPEVRKAAQRRYYARHRESIREKASEWGKRNREKTRLKCRQRYARKKGAEGSHAVTDVLAQLEAQKRRCWWCRCEIHGKRYHVDHRIALANGGSDGPENIVIACPECNVRKNAKMPWEFAEGRLL